MRALAAAAALLLASCYDPSGQCAADAECLEDQVCGADGLCVPGTRPPPGDAPVALADAYAFQGSGPFDVAAAAGVLSNDTAAAGHALTAELVGDPSFGVVLLSPDGGFTYAPVLGFVGADAFTYRASDGVLSSDVTTVSITVAPAPPVALADAYAVARDTALTVAAGAGVLANDRSDPPGRTITATLGASAAHGTVALAADGGFTYTPEAGYAGPDAFTYRANDGSLASAPTTVALTVGP